MTTSKAIISLLPPIVTHTSSVKILRHISSPLQFGQQRPLSSVAILVVQRRPAVALLLLGRLPDRDSFLLHAARMNVSSKTCQPSHR